MELSCNLHAWGCELLDVGTLTLPRYGMSGKTVEVAGWRWHPTELVRLQVAEITQAIFDPVAELTGRDPAPNSTLPRPWDVETLGLPTVTSGTTALRDGSVLTRTRVTWPPVVGESVRAGGSVEVQYWPVAAPLPTGDWLSWTEPGNATEAVIPGLLAGTYYRFRVRAVQQQPHVKGNWSGGVVHQVAAPPSLDWQDVQGRPLLLRVVSRGSSDTQSPGNIAAGLYNGETGAELYGRTRSYMMLRINATTGAATFQQTYDVWGAGATTSGRDASSLASDLNATPAGTLVVVYTHDEPKTNRLTGNLPEALYRCGASRAIFGSAEFKSRGAYLLVGIAGSGEGNGYEAYSGSVDNDTQAWTDVAFQLVSGRLIVSGTGARPRTLADYGYTGALNATRNLIWRQGSAPAVGVTDGDVWFDTSDASRHYARIGGAWVSVRDAGIAQAQGDAAQAIIDAANAQGTADGKVKTFAQASPPTATGVGDLWLDTDDGNRLYRWTGSVWAAQLVGTGAIAPGAATEVFDAFDAGPRTATNNSAPVNVVAAAACKIIVTVTVNAECVNSTGSAKFRNAIVSVYGYGDSLGGGTAYDSRFISRNIANGETQRESYTASYTFSGIAAGADNTFAASVTGTTGATIDTEFTDIRVRVEVIYR
jgi:hypothetical protein